MASSARIDELRKKFEENPRRYFAPLANEYRKAGQIDQAIAICREYLPQQPGHMSGHIVYGQALYEARQFEEAKGVFETALSLDPENLIALRHLGDIALLIGDSDAARTWYRRVLEADPRNEEIQAQLLTLEQASATPSSTPAADASNAIAGTPTSSSAPTVIVDAKQLSSSPATPPHPSDETRRQPWARKTPAPFEAPPASQRSPSAKTQETVAPASPIDPAAAASAPTPLSVPAIELQSTVAGSSPAAALPIETAAVAGLETTSLTGTAPSVEPPLTATRDSGGAGATAPRLSLLDVPAAAEPSAAPPAPEAGPFVTETMADLYLQQGHREEALRVYRALLEQRPGDAGLQKRVKTLESELATSPPTSRPETPTGSPSVPTGPTIREVLEIVAQRRPGFRPAPLRGNGGAPPQAGRQSQGGQAGSAQRQAIARDALSTLFVNAQIASPDESAALVLALAFTELNNGAQLPATPLLEGAPAHRATNELSLDTVFGAGQAAPAGNVSYDQFFAQRPAGSHPAGTAVDAQDDVAHFNKWLEGLKRR